MTTLKSQAEAREQAAEADKLKKRAARQAVKNVAAPVEVETVRCTVLPKGDGKISMGQHVPGVGEAHYEEGEEFTATLKTALALYGRDYINFEGAREAAKAAADAGRAAELAALAEDIAMRRMIEAAEARLAAR